MSYWKKKKNSKGFKKQNFLSHMQFQDTLRFFLICCQIHTLAPSTVLWNDSSEQNIKAELMTWYFKMCTCSAGLFPCKSDVTATNASLTLGPCILAQQSFNAETILHGDRHCQWWQPYLEPMQTNQAQFLCRNNFTWRQTRSKMTALPWANAYRPGNKQFYKETDTWLMMTALT